MRGEAQHTRLHGTLIEIKSTPIDADLIQIKPPQAHPAYISVGSNNKERE
jgi:hypothetical protein